MSFIAILGAGPIGTSVAQRLAERGHLNEIRLIDAATNAAAGKALDIQQSGPIGHFDARLSASADLLSAAGASVIVVADAIAGGEWKDAEGTAMLEPLVRSGSTAPLVFAGPSQTGLMEACHRTLKVPAHRLVGSAAAAIVSAVRALVGLEISRSSVDLSVVGRPPAFVIGWSAATVAGSLVTDRVAAHRLLAISQALPKLWPPGPYAIGAATAQVVEALILGRRALVPAVTILDGELGAQGTPTLLPLELGRRRVIGHVMPSLSPQERTDLVNSLRLR